MNFLSKTIVWIGAGNLATQMAPALQQRGATIKQVYSRTETSAMTLASRLQVPYCTHLQEVADADIYLFALKDNILEEVISQMPPHNDSIWLHTSGSMPMQIFAPYAQQYGVLYPLQTFSKNKKVDWREIPLFIEATDALTLQTLQQFSDLLQTQSYPLSSDQRKYIHLAAVFACNFSNHMWTIASKIIKQTDLPFEVLRPLIKETVEKIETLTPIEAQTGPAIRYDENVIDKHLALLSQHPQWADIYQSISQDIHQTNLHKQQNKS